MVYQRKWHVVIVGKGVGVFSTWYVPYPLIDVSGNENETDFLAHTARARRVTDRQDRSRAFNQGRPRRRDLSELSNTGRSHPRVRSCPGKRPSQSIPRRRPIHRPVKERSAIPAWARDFPVDGTHKCERRGWIDEVANAALPTHPSCQPQTSTEGF